MEQEKSLWTEWSGGPDGAGMSGEPQQKSKNWTEKRREILGREKSGGKMRGQAFRELSLLCEEVNGQTQSFLQIYS